MAAAATANVIGNLIYQWKSINVLRYGSSNIIKLIYIQVALLTSIFVIKTSIKIANKLLC